VKRDIEFVSSTRSSVRCSWPQEYLRGKNEERSAAAANGASGAQDAHADARAYLERLGLKTGDALLRATGDDTAETQAGGASTPGAAADGLMGEREDGGESALTEMAPRLRGAEHPGSDGGWGGLEGGGFGAAGVEQGTVEGANEWSESRLQLDSS